MTSKLALQRRTTSNNRYAPARQCRGVTPASSLQKGPAGLSLSFQEKTVLTARDMCAMIRSHRDLVGNEQTISSHATNKLTTPSNARSGERGPGCATT